MQHYDPRGRPTVAIAPDGSQTQLVYGVPANLGDPASAEPTPWEIYTYDANGNAARTHPTWTLDLAAQWDTPSSSVTRRARANRLNSAARPRRQRRHDICLRHRRARAFGNRSARPAGRGFTVYDLAGQAWLTWRLDAGAARTAYDSSGGVAEHRDDKDAVILTAYDPAHRAVRHWAADRAAQNATLRLLTIFGDDQQESGLTEDQAANINVRGRIVAAYDEAGRVTSMSYDLDGNLLGSTRQVIRPDLLFSLVPASGSGQWTGTSYSVDWQPAVGQTLADRASTLLDAAAFTTDAQFDALGRRTASTCPDDVTGRRAAIAIGYGRSGGVTSITVDGVPYLTQAGYDAHGRRSFAFLGNGVLIRYRYDPRELRLRRLRAEQATTAAAGTWACDGPVLQDHSYRYDLAGNLLTLGDRTPGCGIPPGDPDALDRQFSYDALDRLAAATGRETDVVPAQPWIDVPRSTDVTKARAYTEQYNYDDVGSMLGLRHRTDASGTGAYTRTFAVPTEGNQLASLSVGPMTVAYTYDPCGNMSTEADTRFFEWDHAGRLSTFRDQADTALPTVYAQYRYDPSGQRVMKIVRRNGGPDEITLYLDEFERVLRGTIGSALTAFDEVQLADNGSGMAAIRRGDPLPDDPMPDQPVRYQLTDHLRSITATLAGDGTLLNREEYLPFGETAFGSYARKRYRFTGKRRDEESGLAYHGQRYYAPWIANWISSDPAAEGNAAYSPYHYCRDNPVNRVDGSGLVSELTQENSNPAEPDLDLVRGPYKPAGGGGVGGHHTQQLAAFRDPATGTDPFRNEVTTTAVGQGDFSQAQHDAASNVQNRMNARLQGKESGTSVVEGVNEVTISAEGNGSLKPTANPYAEQVKAFFAWRAAGAPGKQALKLVNADVSERQALAAKSGKSPFPTRAPGFASLDLMAGIAGMSLTAVAAAHTVMNISAAYQLSKSTGSAVPIVEQGTREIGSWGGGSLGGFLLGAAVGVETGPGALITGLIGGYIGSHAGGTAANSAIESVHSLAQSAQQGFDAFIKPLYSPSSPSPWGGW